jgi:hypothetical protein
MHRIAKGSLQLARRLGVFVVGAILLLAGIIMIVTPGPAIVFIPLGLAVLATEFQWARSLLAKARPMIDRGIERPGVVGGAARAPPHDQGSGGGRRPHRLPGARSKLCAGDPFLQNACRRYTFFATSQAGGCRVLPRRPGYTPSTVFAFFSP